MSEKLGPLSFGRRESAFLGDALGRPQSASEATAEAIDDEVAALVRQSHARARQLLSERRRGLDRLAATLEAAENLEGDSLDEALADAKVRDSDRNRDPNRTMVA
jgi:cell division protease FtsH